MAVDNNVSIAGNLVADPELRYTNNGAAIAGLRMAVNRRWNKDGEWEEETSYFDVTAWAQLAENCAESLTKGMRINVAGRLEEQRWEDKESKAYGMALNGEVAPRKSFSSHGMTCIGDRMLSVGMSSK